MTSIKEDQVKLVKSHVGNLGKSEEQFIFMLYKTKEGEYNVTAHSYNIPVDVLRHFLMKELGRGMIRDNEEVLK